MNPHKSKGYSSNVHFLMVLIGLLFMHACSSPEQPYVVYVGTYTGSGSEGIYGFHFDADRGELKPIGVVAKTVNPTFLAIDPQEKFLYAVNETDSFQHTRSGSVSVYAIQEKGKLELIQQVSSLGADPAHLSLDRSARNLMVANYHGGNAVVFPVDADGKLNSHSSLIQNTGSGLDAGRQEGPHPHFIQTTPDNRFATIVDLGIDQVMVYQFAALSGALSAFDAGTVKLPPGSGPRHLAFSSNGKFVYVLNELTSDVAVFAMDSNTGIMKRVQTITALPEDFRGTSYAAEILVDHKGKFLYLSNRGSDTIGVFQINQDSGWLTKVEWVSSGGKSPRHFEIDPTGKWLLVANQLSNNMVLFKRDEVNGALVQTSQAIEINSPVCIRFMDSNGDPGR